MKSAILLLFATCILSFGNILTNPPPDLKTDELGVIFGYAILEGRGSPCAEDYLNILFTFKESNNFIGQLGYAIASGDWDQYASFQSGSGVRMEREGAFGHEEAALACLLLSFFGEKDAELLRQGRTALGTPPDGWSSLGTLMWYQGYLAASATLGDADSAIEESARQFLQNLESKESSVLQLAIAAHCCALSSAWEMGQRYRERLLARQNADGGWGANGHSDFVESCYAEIALDCFENESQKAGIDLSIPQETLFWRQQDGKSVLSGVLFNLGNEASGAFRITAVLSYQDGHQEEWGQTDVANLSGGKSLLVEFNGELPDGVTGGYLLADAAGSLQESNRSNNVAWCSLGDSEEKTEIYLTPIHVNGYRPERIYLWNGKYARIECSALADKSTEFTWELLDQETILASGTSSGQDVHCIVNWYPDAGEHTLTWRIRKNNEVKQSCQYTVKVVQAAGIIECGRLDASGNLQKDQAFRAREYVSFFCEGYDSTWEKRLVVQDEQGADCGEAAATGRTEYYQWHTGVLSPGRYTAILLFYKRGTKIKVAQTETEFTITETADYSNLQIAAPIQSRTYFQNEKVPVTAEFTWNAIVNYDAEPEITWEWLGTDGNTLNSGSQKVTGQEEYQQETTMPITLAFAEPGEYTLQVTLTAGEHTLTASRAFTATAIPEVTIINSVTPATATTLPVRAQTVIRLESSNPVLERGVLYCCKGEIAAPELKDDGEEACEIILHSFRNAGMQSVQIGECYATTPYGTFSGENIELLPRESCCTALLSFSEGRCSFRYKGKGTQLLEGEAATIPICIYGKKEDDTPGELLETLEVFLLGVKKKEEIE